MILYHKMVQAAERNFGWCEYEDGHLDVSIRYNVYGGVHNAMILVKGKDDTCFVKSSSAFSLREINNTISRYLDIFHLMPKYIKMDWLIKMGFENC